MGKYAIEIPRTEHTSGYLRLDAHNLQEAEIEAKMLGYNYIKNSGQTKWTVILCEYFVDDYLEIDRFTVE